MVAIASAVAAAAVAAHPASKQIDVKPQAWEKVAAAVAVSAVVAAVAVSTTTAGMVLPQAATTRKQH